ncbi:MAG: PIN domain-containing protein [Acidobacteriota bacterium]
MIAFVDTSEWFALLDADDQNHAAARKAWLAALNSSDALVTSNYVLVETVALVQHRLGIDAVRALWRDLLPPVEVEWVTSEEHAAAMAALVAAGRRGLSLVDCTSFQIMRRMAIEDVLAFDRHFEEQGFRLFR